MNNSEEFVKVEKKTENEFIKSETLDLSTFNYKTTSPRSSASKSSQKSSMEILSELFQSFNAEPPVIVKQEPGKTSKHKKSHKHKKKSKHKDVLSKEKKLDLAEILITQEKELAEKRIKIDGTDLCVTVSQKVKIEHVDSDSRSRRKSSDTRDRKRTASPSVAKHTTAKSSRKSDTIIQSKILCSKSRRSRSKSVENKHHTKRGEAESHRKDNDFYSNVRDNWVRRRSRSRKTRSQSHNYARRDRTKCWESIKSRLGHRHSIEDNYRRGYKDELNQARERDPNYIDKKKLLEIATRNAIRIMKSGSLPGAISLGPRAQEKMIAALRAGGKTVDELTNFCKALSKKEALGELSGLSDNESNVDEDNTFNHPFIVKERPSTITMNIKNSVPLPTKSNQERSSELGLQFPVSSGQQHRSSEKEWITVDPKETSSSPAAKVKPNNLEQTKQKHATAGFLPSTSTPTSVPLVSQPLPQAGLEVAPSSNTAASLLAYDIDSIVSHKLMAMRQMQEASQNNSISYNSMQATNSGMAQWSTNMYQTGVFTGTTGVQILSPAELSAGCHAWVKKDQFQKAAPVSGGIGMHLLQKMGWHPGEGLGKEKTGALEPLLLEVKFDKRGLVAEDEQQKHKGINKKTNQQQPQPKASASVQNLLQKHPVSLLGEYTSKRKLGAPLYTLCMEAGPPHQKSFIFKVNVNGVDYQSNTVTSCKKDAKAAAATACLQQLGILPGTTTQQNPTTQTSSIN